MASDDNISIFDSDEEEDAKEETLCRKKVWIERLNGWYIVVTSILV